MKIYELEEWEEYVEYVISLDYYIYKKWGRNSIAIDSNLGGCSKVVYCLKYDDGYRLIAIGYENNEWYVLYNNKKRSVQDIKLLSDNDVVINKLHHYGYHYSADEYFLNGRWDKECVKTFKLWDELETNIYKQVMSELHNDKEERICKVNPNIIG